METNNCADELQPIAECFIKQEIKQEPTSPELQNNEVDRDEEVNMNRLLYTTVVTEAGAHATHEQHTGKHPSSSIQNELLAQPGSSVWSSNDVSPIDNSNLKENPRPTTVQLDQPRPVQSSDSKPSLSEQPLRCSQCSYETVKRHFLEIHNQRHSGKRFLDCDECEFKTSIEENLVAHMTTKHVKKERYNCKRCDTILSTVEKYAYHLFRHKGNTIFKCSVCNILFTNERFLDRHKTLRHSPLYFKCRFCDFCSATSTNLRDHVRNEHEQSM
ncbi:zinc finger protein 431 [Nilaparvata lugens]|uniref:zinc finger protein 431 n=1 Tax=Nilaparvata lugens TaxID=108931 RepID=UPI00193D839E|nr:zinc finger protein 431 [Nilaparvata lugens]